MPANDHLTWLETFISNNYSKQAGWVRTVVFLVFVFVLVFAMYRTIGGDFDLKGRVLEKISDAELHVPANWYEIQLGPQSFGVCRNGDFRIILSWMDYLGAMTSGKLSVQIFLPNGGVETQNLKVHRAGFQDLDDIVIPIAATAQHEPPRTPAAGRTIPWLPSFTVEASAPPAQGARLLVESISMPSSALAAREVEVSLAASGSAKTLLLKPTSEPSGPVTVMPGKTVSYNEDHYFALDSAPWNGVSQLGDITITTQRGFLQSNYSERFHLPPQTAYGEVFEAAGTNGGRLRLRLVYPWVLQMYDRAEIPGGMAGLKQALLDRGFDSRPTPMPAGSSMQTNFLAISRMVPLRSAQTILQVLNDRGVRLKRVQTGADTLQLGGLEELNGAPELGEERMQKMIAAKSVADFNLASTCCSMVQRAPMRQMRVKK